MSGSVVVIGSVNVDYVVTVETLPVAGQTVSGGRFARYGGGKGANQAVAAARAGATVRLVGCVGADAEGARAIAELAQEGIDVSGVDTTPAAATGIALIVVDAAGANQIAVASGANRLVADMPRTVLEGATGVLLLSFEAPDSALEVARQPGPRRGVAGTRQPCTHTTTHGPAARGETTVSTKSARGGSTDRRPRPRTRSAGPARAVGRTRDRDNGCGRSVAR